MLGTNPSHLEALQCCLKKNRENLALDDLLYLHVFAPSMVEFVEWVLEEAVRSGKKRLYFLARDGWIMYETAKAVCRKRNLSMDCRYLQVSRYAVRTAQYHLLGKSCLNLICVGGIDVTFRKIMQRGMLTGQEAEEIAALCGYENQMDQVLHVGQVQELKRRLADIPSFFSYVDAHSRDMYPNVMGYLRQEGLLDGISYALVDSGWVGTLQQSVEHLVNTAFDGKGRVVLQGYYFGLYEIPAGADLNGYHGYYFEPGNHLKRKVRFSNCLFETVFSAPEGMTLCYEDVGEHYAACISKSPNPNAAQLKKHHQLQMEYTEIYVSCTDGAEKSRKDRVAENLLGTLMGEPVNWEVQALGGGLFCDDILESQMQPVAAPLLDAEIQKQRFFRKLLIVLNLKKEEIHESAWLEGSIVQNGTQVKKSLRHAALYKYLIYMRKALKKR